MVEHHDPIVLYGRGHHWVECTCGWISLTWNAQVGAVAEHAGHVRVAKEGADA